MTNLVLPSTAAARLVIAPITALALLLPLPACCSACSPADHQPDAKKACCQNHATAGADLDLLCVSQHASPCGCSIQPTDRSPRQSDKISSLIDLSSALPSATLAVFNHDAIALSERLRLDNVALTIPHRILHCSWQI
jgi:hypothetical protein